MNNFYNKKDKYIDNDFEIEGDDFLNSSMRDMDARTKSNKKKKKINQDYDDGIQFVDLASLDREALFKSNIRTPENSEYMSTVLRGFIFIFMLLISLFAIFLIFKTPYYSYYNQDEPIILGENKNIINSDPFSITSSTSKTTDQLKEEILEPEEQSNVKLPTAVISKPKTKISDEDEMLRRDFENSKTATNKQDTELTKLLKNSENVAVVEKSSKNPIQNKPIENKMVTNDTPDDVPAEENSSTNFKYPAMGDKKMVTDSSQVFAKENGNTELSSKPVVTPKPKVPAKVEPQIAKQEKIQENKPNNVAEQNVWLVNIYSTSKKDEIHERLLRLKNQYKSALMGTTFYLVENKTEKGTNYRISVTENQSGIAYPSFTNAVEAKSFCTTLKSQGLDCFVSSVYKSSLPRYIIK